MKLLAYIQVEDNPRPMFTTELASLTGDDGTQGSISIISAPLGSQREGSPYLMGVRASRYVEFEHEGRRGRFDLADLFTDWVDALGDHPELQEVADDR